MPKRTPDADRSHGGAGSSHENGDRTSSRTWAGDKVQPQSKSLNAKHDGSPDGDAHGHHAEVDQSAKDNHKADHGGKP